MRVPHTIPGNTYEVYKPSRVTGRLLGERDRTLKSEDVEWDKQLPPSLVASCVEALVENFQEKQVLDELPDEDRDLLYETLPTDLPLTLTVPILVDEIYWKRSAMARWTSPNYVKDCGNSWKRLYLERHIQEYLEQLAVEDYNRDDVVALVKLCAPSVRKLVIRQLKLSLPPPSTEWEGDECTVEPEPTDHIDLEPVLRGLQLLVEIDLMFGVRDSGMDFEWKMFHFSEKDTLQLAMGLERCKYLKILRIHRSHLDDARLITVLQHLAKNKTIIELDLSHCRIADQGALALGKFLTIHPTLAILNLLNNKIGPAGVRGLAYGLTKCVSPLDLLSLRLNPIGEAGVLDLCAALTRSSRPRELRLSGCRITEPAIIKIGQMLQQNKTLQHLDLANNNLGEVGGEALELGMKDNTTLMRLDLRMTGIARDQEVAINTKLEANSSKWRRKKRRIPVNEGLDAQQTDDLGNVMVDNSGEDSEDSEVEDVQKGAEKQEESEQQEAEPLKEGETQEGGPQKEGETQKEGEQQEGEQPKESEGDKEPT